MYSYIVQLIMNSYLWVFIQRSSETLEQRSTATKLPRRKLAEVYVSMQVPELYLHRNPSALQLQIAGLDRELLILQNLIDIRNCIKRN